jgi:putative ABC transport system substrate-binding protein
MGQAMRRREFVKAIAGLAAWWPLSARAQQPAMPVIGFLSSASPKAYEHFVVAFKAGLAEVGYVDGKNVSIDYMWADDRYDRLPALAAELVRRQVSVIVASGGPVPARAAKAATSAIPIVFTALSDPVKLGLVASFNKPGTNVTGVAALTSELDAKRLEILRELVPNAETIGALVDSNRQAEGQVEGIQAAGRAAGRQLVIVSVGNEKDFVGAFETLHRRKVGGLVVAASAFFTSRRDRLIELAARYSMPTIFQFRDFATAGGLVSYGASGADSYRNAGLYTGRILQGEKPADLPVIQPTKFELVINLRTAKALGVTVPRSLLVAADEVIE